MGESSQQIRRVLAPFANREHLLQSFIDEGSCGGLFLPREKPLAVGELLELEVVLVEELMIFHVRGRVAWVGSQDPTRGTGVGVHFDAGDERTKKLMLEFARGRDMHSVVRRPRRFPVALRVAYSSERAFTYSLTGDMSTGGAFIQSEAPLDRGTLIALRIEPPASAPVQLNAEVVWRAQGLKRGFGVKFLTADEEKVRRIGALVAARAG